MSGCKGGPLDVRGRRIPQTKRLMEKDREKIR